MRIISDTTDFQLQNDSAVAIGKFDGLHLGHRRLFDELAEARARYGLQITIFTFDPSPARFFSGGSIKELMTKEEKRERFRALGADVLIEFPLREDTAAIAAEDFVRGYLAGRLRAKIVAAGGDLSFGYRGAGDFALLRSLANELDYTPVLIEKVLYEGAEISSTRVREAVGRGDMEEAEMLLGAPYRIEGVVEKGRQLGRTIGFPTANVIPPEDKLLPPYGVYCSRTVTEKGIFAGITNIGVKPTVTNDTAVSCETYFFDGEGDFYGSRVSTELLHFVREERRFDGIDALKAQIAADTGEAKRFFGFT